ncbi:MAG: hypothetical protein ABL888_14260 [Pirellulaceae bacterium]
MQTNPYVPPHNVSTIDEATSTVAMKPNREILTSLICFVICTSLGGFVGFAGYLISLQILESVVMPQVDPPIYTYGQAAFLGSLPLSTILGVAAGLTLAGFISGWRRVSLIAMFGVATLGVFVTFWLWSNDTEYCNSAIVLYYPIFGLCGLIITTCGVLCSALYFRRWSKSS